jgi:Mg-chelatase subunit ChlD
VVSIVEVTAGKINNLRRKWVTKMSNKSTPNSSVTSSILNSRSTQTSSRDSRKIYSMILGAVLTSTSMTSCGKLVGPKAGNGVIPTPVTTDTSNVTVNDVLIIGTSVNPKTFYASNEFTITATPRDAAGNAILGANQGTSVVLQTTTQASPSAIPATPSTAVTLPASVQINIVHVSSADVRIAIDVDASGSMGGSDPMNLRIEGAKIFVDSMAANRKSGSYALSMLDFGAGSTRGLTYSNLLQDFTNDSNLLKAAADKIQSSGSTPTYESLLEIVPLVVAGGSKSSDQRILLFSDGSPNSTSDKQKTCDLAIANNVKIDSIGLGAASDVSAISGASAVSEMRSIANCSGGSYFGIATKKDPSGTEVLDQVSLNGAFTAMSVGASQGSVSYKVVLGSPAASLNAGTVIDGTLTITSGGATKSGQFKFAVPAKP